MTTGGYTLEPVQVTDLKAVTEDVVYRAPGKNELEIRKAVCEAAREFLRRTGVWKEIRRCVHVQDSWFGFRHGYLHAMVLRVDSFMEGVCLQRMEGTPGDGVAPIPCGIPMPRIGNVYAPSLASFIEQGGYVLVAAPGCGLPPAIPDPYQQEDCTIAPVMAGSCQGSEGTVVFTLGLAFTGESIPSAIVQQYGAVIADGAAHLLLTGPTVARTAYGDRFTNACDALAMRMANGGPTAAVTGTIFDGLAEV
jgi:subtilisin family serine protease